MGFTRFQRIGTEGTTVLATESSVPIKKFSPVKVAPIDFTPEKGNGGGLWQGIKNLVPEPVKQVGKLGLRTLGVLADIPFTTLRAGQSVKVGLKSALEETEKKRQAGRVIESPLGKKFVPEEFLFPGLRPSFWGAFLKDWAGIGRKIGDYEKVPFVTDIAKTGGEFGNLAKVVTEHPKLGLGVDVAGELIPPSPMGEFGLYRKAGQLAEKIPAIEKAVIKGESIFAKLGKTIREGKVGEVIAKYGPGQKYFQHPEIFKILRTAEENIGAKTKGVARWVQEVSKTLKEGESKIIGQLMENRNIIPDILQSVTPFYKIGGEKIPIERIKKLATVAGQALAMRDEAVRALAETGIITEKSANVFLSRGYLRYLYPEHVKDALKKLSIPLEDMPPLSKIRKRISGRPNYIKEFQAPFFVGLAEDVKRAEQAKALRAIAERYGIKVEKGLKLEDVSQLALKEASKLKKLSQPRAGGLGLTAAEETMTKAKSVSERLARSGVFISPEEVAGDISKATGYLREPKSLVWEALANFADRYGTLKVLPKEPRVQFVLEDILQLVKKNPRLNSQAKLSEIKARLGRLLGSEGIASVEGYTDKVGIVQKAFRKMIGEFGENKETLRRTEALRSETNKQISNLAGLLEGKQGFYYNRKILDDALQSKNGPALEKLIELRDELNEFSVKTRGIGIRPQELGLVEPPAGRIPEEILPPGYRETAKTGQIRKVVPPYVPTPDVYKKIGKSAQVVTEEIPHEKLKMGVVLNKVDTLPKVKSAELYVPTVKEQNLLPEGYKMASEALKGRIEDPEVAARVLENSALPTEMWDKLLEGRQSIEKRPWIREMLSVYKTFMGIWKATKTIFRPAYFIRNQSWNELMVSNVTGKKLSIPGSLTHSIMAYFGGDGNAIQRTLKKITGEQSAVYLKEADALNLIKRENVTSLAKEIVRKYGPAELRKVKFPTYARDFQQFQEDISKMEIYSHFRNKGASGQTAADIASETIFSPERISRETRGFYSAIWPFFSFSYQAVPAVIKYGIKNPDTVRTLERLELALSRGSDNIDERYLPEYYKGYIALPGKTKEGFFRYITTQYISPYRHLEAEGEFSPFSALGTNPFFLEIPVNTLALLRELNGKGTSPAGWDYFKDKPVSTSSDPEQRKADLFKFLIDKVGPESVFGIPFPGGKVYREMKAGREGVTGPLGIVKSPKQVFLEQFQPTKPILYSPQKSKQMQTIILRGQINNIKGEMYKLNIQLREKRISQKDYADRMGRLRQLIIDNQGKIMELSKPRQ